MHSRIVIARALRARGNLTHQLPNSPKLPCYPPGACEIAPQGHFLALRAQGATSACGLLAMTHQGSMVLGTVHCTELAVLLPLRGRAWLSPTLQLQAFPSKPAKKIGSRLRPRPGSGCLFKKGRKKRESIGKLILQRSAAEAEAPREAVAAALLLLLALILLLALLRIA